MYNSTQTEEEFLDANKAGILQRTIDALRSFARRYLSGPAGPMGPMGMRGEPGPRAPLTAYVADEERVPESIIVVDGDVVLSAVERRILRRLAVEEATITKVHVTGRDQSWRPIVTVEARAYTPISSLNLRLELKR